MSKNTVKVNMETVSPKFDLGETVYALLGPSRYVQGEITAYRTWALKDRDGNIVVLPNAVRLSAFTHGEYFEDIESDAVPFRYLTDNEEQAIRWSQVTSVKCSDEDWFKAIGKRPTFEEMVAAGKLQTFDSDDSLEESELGSCCANLAQIRTMLIKCKENTQLTMWEVELLQECCDNACHDFPEDAPILKNILMQLNVKWS
jgi:hypothetical protein